MDMRDDPDDDQLEDELRRLAARLEPVPAELIASAVGAYHLRGIDVELAELVFDSLLDEDATTLVRGGTERLVTFRRGDLTIDVEVTGSGPTRDLTGQVEPPRAAVVNIRHRAGEASTEADELGRFRAEGLPPGPMRLQIRLSGPDRALGRPLVATDWITI